MNLIDISEEDKSVVRKYFNKSEDDIKRDVEIIKDWLKKQPHLPPIPDDSFIERMLLRTKFRVEKAKECIDSYFTIKTIWPETFQGIHEIVPSKMSGLFFRTDKLTENKELVVFCSFNAPPEEYDLFEVLRVKMAYLELVLKSDYTLGIHIVFDFTMTEFGHLKQLSLVNILQKGVKAALHVHSLRVRGIYIYKPPSWISIFVELIKPLLSKKIMDRISLHKDNDSLLKMLPKECLPVEYGGTNKTVKELIKESDELHEANREFLEQVQRNKSNEKLRIGGKCRFESDMFGVDGTFKRLNID